MIYYLEYHYDDGQHSQHKTTKFPTEEKAYQFVKQVLEPLGNTHWVLYTKQIVATSPGFAV